jgi:glyoxylase-like metal-dependent hydrolase (beta-lactamase superfamily II)
MPEQPQAYIPNVYGLVDGPVNAYLLDAGESGLVVIDAGLPGSIRRMIQLIRDIGRSPQDVRHILITHADIDHVGSLKPLVDAAGAAVYASQQTASYIQRCQSPPHISFPMIVVVGTMNRLFRRPVPVDHIVKDNDLLDIAGGIRVLETPGHTPDHISFYWERERVLFVGDLLDNEGQLEVSRRSTWSREESYKSTRRVLALKPAVICPGHGHVWQEEHQPEQITQLKASLPVT